METIRYIENCPLVHIGSRKYVAPTEILHLESDLNYTKIMLVSGKKIVSSTTMKIIEGRLSPFKNFVRVNRQNIVNLDWVKRIEEKTLFLPGEIILSFSRRQLKVWKNFHIESG